MKKSEAVTTTPPTISVVIPAYNCAQFIEKCLDSIFDQSIADFEIIVIDDASTDETGSKLKHYNDPRLTIYRNDSNLGYLKTANLGLSLAQGQYICFQDADDWSCRTRLELQLSEFQKDSELMLCGTNCIKYYCNEVSISVKYPETSSTIYNELLNFRTPLFCGATLMFRQDLIEKIGVYNPLFDRIGAEDTDWYIRALESFKAKNIQQPLYYWRQHLGSFTHSKAPDTLKDKSLYIALTLHQLRTYFKIKPTPEHEEAIKNLLLKQHAKDTSSTYFQNLTTIISTERNSLFAKLVLWAMWSKPARAILGLVRKKRSLKLAKDVILQLNHQT